MLRDLRLDVKGRAFDVLVALVRRQGDLVSKQALLDEVWPGVVVQEHNVTTQVLNLRRLFAEHDRGTNYIATDTGRGYRFVAQVTSDAGPTLEVPAPESPASRVPEAPPTLVPEAPPALAPEAPPALAPEAPPTPAREAPPTPAPGTVAPATTERHNLPTMLNSFIGREAEVALITARLQTSALLTLVGTGGIGKTRCALQVGHAMLRDFPDGVWLVELAPLAEGGLVAEALCRVIGAAVAGERDAADLAVAFLRHKRLLLILDNCEQVLDASARLAAALAQNCAGIKILATSRQHLGVYGERVLRLPSLPLPPPSPPGHEPVTAAEALRSDAVRLFVDRADAAAGGYVLTDADAPAVVTICRRLDGVALAVELAAARVRMLKPAEIAARLEDVFRLLTGGSPVALARHHTLRATIDWSFALLSPAEQLLLCRLSVFVDGFSLAGATAVGSGGSIAASDVLDLLTALVDKSLVAADTSAAATRYRMLGTTRHYALEKLAALGEAGAVRRMAEYLADFFGRGEATWPVTPTDVWLAEFGPEVENLRAAIDWAFGEQRPQASDGAIDAAGDPALGIALVAAAGSVAEEMSLLADMKRWTAAAQPHLSADTPKGRAGWVLYWVTRHQSIFGVRELSDLRREMIDLFRQAGDPVGLSCALRTTGMAMARRGANDNMALEMLTEAVALLEPKGPSKDLATALAHVGSLHYFDGSDALARQYTEAALAMRQALGDHTGLLISYINLGEFAFVRGDVAEAIGYATDAVAQARQCRLLEILGTASSNLANYLLATDDLAGARAAAVEAVTIHRALGNHDHAILCLEHLALERLLAGDPVRAACLFGYTDGHFNRTGQVRDRSEQLRYERLERMLAACLPAARRAALMAEGSAWNAEQADDAALRPDAALPGPPNDEAGKLHI